jgi:hypothetical protein
VIARHPIEHWWRNRGNKPTLVRPPRPTLAAA